ncbi:hypothetical protein PhCBS80983_g04342 [Powellomyces hirtus]|uniref:Rab-GAP TBC domain-containing protein n=1 Tax=Powellomyces hirtus TaxID=109895 RepID=A0A507DZ69_9FUNG|nr:hypothetical protein PhCBS80983_g04342 [Powellomyces hirtus]
MSAPKMQLLFALSHVAMRSDELNPSMGFLCLVEQEGIGVLLSWIPKSKIPRAELDVYADLVAKTKKARKTLVESQSDYTIVNAVHTLSSVTESVSAPVEDIETVAIGRALTLDSSAEEICLTRLVVALTFEGAQLPELWFEKDELGRAASINDVEDDLRGWFATVGRNMNKLLRERDPEETAVLTYFSLDVNPGASIPIAGQEPGARPVSPHRWPETWPAVSEGSAVYRLGSLGFNMVTNIVGQPMATKIEDAGWNMLERFSKVTNYAKSTTEAEALLEEYEPAGHYIARFAADLQSRLGSHQHPVQPVKAAKDTTREFENLAVGRKHHRTGRPLSAEQWVSWYGPDGRLTMSEHDIKAIVFAGGVENDVRVDVWKYLLKVYPYTSTEAERAEISKQHVTRYEDIKTQWKLIYNDAASAEAAALAAGQSLPTRDTQAGDEKEDADVVTKIRERKYRVDKDVVRTDRTVPFFAEEAENDDSSNNGNAVSPADLHLVVHASKNLEMLSNILVSYTMYNFELGYVQGMNDLLAPILVVMQNENDSFWCFVEFMNMMQSNFFRDQSGMRNQLRRLELLIKFLDPYLYAHMESTDSINLFCCFRWLLILFKREFDFGDSMRLWEVLWACPLSKDFHLFVAFAILNRHRSDLLGKVAFDETLKFINDLANHIHLESTLERAEVLFEVFREAIGEAAAERLGVDLAVDAAAGGLDAVQQQGQDQDQDQQQTKSSQLLDVPLAGSGIRRLRDRSRSGERPVSSSSSSWEPPSSPSCPAPPPGSSGSGLVQCTEEELWELVGLLERRG